MIWGQRELTMVYALLWDVLLVLSIKVSLSLKTREIGGFKEQIKVDLRQEAGYTEKVSSYLQRWRSPVQGIR